MLFFNTRFSFVQVTGREVSFLRLLEFPASAARSPSATAASPVPAKGAGDACALCKSGPAIFPTADATRRRGQGQVQVSVLVGGDGGGRATAGEGTRGRAGIAGAHGSATCALCLSCSLLKM